MELNKRIAIIGGGMAGLTAAYLLSRNHEVVLYERQPRLGGNAYGHSTKDGDCVDIAVAAFGRRGYVHFYRLLAELGISPVIVPGAAFSTHGLDGSKGMYVTPSWKGLRAQNFEILHPSHVVSYFRFRAWIRKAAKLLMRGELDMSVEAALSQLVVLDGEERKLFIFLLALLSSMSCEEVIEAPAAFFVEKLLIHKDFFSPLAALSFRAIPGGTKRYIDALVSRSRARIVLAADVQAIARDSEGVDIILGDGQKERFDKVVMAANADQSLRLLDEPTDLEQELLGSWSYKDGTVVVHDDLSQFPADELIQAYTMLYTEGDGKLDTSITGSFRHLPGVSSFCRHVSTQHPNFPIRQERIDLETVLRTPMFDYASCKTVDRLPELNGERHTYYCGSYFGHGLHEDCVTSAIEVSRALGVDSTF